MASLTQNVVKKLADKNRKYWNLREMLLTTTNTYQSRRSSSPFILHNELWRYVICTDHFTSVSPSLSILLFIFDNGVTDHFNVKMGICRESGENIVMSNAKVVSTVEFEVTNLISDPQLDLILQSNELFLFFVEIEDKANMRKRKFETDYKELLLSGKNSDFTINVKHRKFNCHTLILGARSPVFSAMMEHEMKEKRSGEVFIPDTDPAIFQDFLLYLYTGKKEHLNLENIMDLYKLGDKYCVDDLKYLCVEHMKRNMSIENFFEFFLISQQHSELELSQVAIKFFIENSEDIIETKMWTEFMIRCSGETCVLIKALAKQNKKCICNLYFHL